jgi:hypothetical protein
MFQTFRLDSIEEKSNSILKESVQGQKTQAGSSPESPNENKSNEEFKSSQEINPV